MATKKAQPTTAPEIPLADLHKARIRQSAKEAKAKERLAEEKAKTEVLEAQILVALAKRREQGEAPTAKMKDGTTYTEAHRTPYGPITPESKGDITAELVKLDLLEMLGAPLYGQLKTEYPSTRDLPGKLGDYIVEKSIPYLSITEGK